MHLVVNVPPQPQGSVCPEEVLDALVCPLQPLGFHYPPIHNCCQQVRSIQPLSPEGVGESGHWSPGSLLAHTGPSGRDMGQAGGDSEPRTSSPEPLVNVIAAPPPPPPSKADMPVTGPHTHCEAGVERLVMLGGLHSHPVPPWLGGRESWPGVIRHRVPEFSPQHVTDLGEEGQCSGCVSARCSVGCCHRHSLIASSQGPCEVGPVTSIFTEEDKQGLRDTQGGLTMFTHHNEVSIK